MNITLSIQAPELSKAIESLASAIQAKPGQVALLHASEAVVPSQEITHQQVAQVNPAQAPAQQAAPMQCAAPPAQQAPQQAQYVAPPVQAPVQQPPAQEPQQNYASQQTAPTSAPAYAIDQLAVAATQLMDAGKRNELMGLLATFGVQALTDLPKEQFGAFATRLRGLGANI